MNNRTRLYVKGYDNSQIEAVRTLWREQYDTSYMAQRERLFKWLSEKNPFFKKGSTYFLLCTSEKVVGMDGFMPIELSVNGTLRRYIRFSHDTLFRVDSRGKGYFDAILQGMLGQVDSPVAGLWPNEHMLKSCIKKGWLNVPNFYAQVKIFDPDFFLHGRIKNPILLKVLSKILQIFIRMKDVYSNLAPTDDVEIVEIGKFDQQFDRFFETISGYLGIIAVRSKDYLNWKFVEKPFNNYRRYAAFEKNGELAGYMVTKKENVDGMTRGKVLDILADPKKPKIFRALVRKGMQEFSSIGASYVGIVCTFPPFRKELRTLGFLRSRTPERLMLYNWEPEFEKSFVSNINNWYLTYSDSDGDAWEVDS